MAREYFCAYHSYLGAMEQLTDEERGRLFTALLAYSQTGEPQQLSGNERFVFPAMRDQIDRDSRKYASKCETQAQNARKRWDATACNGIPRHAKYANEKEKEKTKTKEKEKEKENIKGVPGGTPADKPPKTRAFVPPSVEEVRAYCLERGNGIDPQYFVDYYDARGWMIGKNKMKDWRAAVRTWERNDSGRTAQKEDSAIGDDNAPYNPYANVGLIV